MAMCTLLRRAQGGFQQSTRSDRYEEACRNGKAVKNTHEYFDQPSVDNWPALELDTELFFPAVVPSWAAEHSGQTTAPRSLLVVIKAGIKNTGNGFVVRLIHQVKSGYEEIANIHMSRSSEANRYRIANWLSGIPKDAKAPTIVADESPQMSDDDDDDDSISQMPPKIGDAMIYEMMVTLRPHELHETGFMPVPGSRGRAAPTRPRLSSAPSVCSTSTCSTTSIISRNSVISDVTNADNISRLRIIHSSAGTEHHTGCLSTGQTSEDVRFH